MNDALDSDRLGAVAALAGLPSGFEALFQAAPSPFLVLAPPDYRIIAVNDAYLSATMTEREVIVGRALFDVFPANPADPAAGGPRHLRESLDRVMEHRRLDVTAVIHYDIPRPAELGGGFEQRWWRHRNAPILGPDGDVVCIIHHVEDATAAVRAEAVQRQIDEVRARADTAIRESEQRYRTLYESMDEGFCTAEVLFDETGKAVDYRFLQVNAAFARQTGIENATGRRMREIAPDHEEYWFERYGHVALTGEPVRFMDQAVQLGRWFDVYAFRLEDPQLRRIGIVLHDVTERIRIDQALRASLAEREALLRELHHRVKNNLQVITSLLELQARHTTETAALAPLTEARHRITAIATIHELLYQSGSLSAVDFAAYARRLVQHLVSLNDPELRIDASVTGEGISVDLARAVPLGLLLNELVSNVYKHAFPSGSRGELRIALREDDSNVCVHVGDTGIGLPSGFDERSTTTLGVQLVRMLTKQLGGTVTFESAGGTRVVVRVPAR